jgi:hypothetical protein
MEENLCNKLELHDSICTYGGGFAYDVGAVLGWVWRSQINVNYANVILIYQYSE